MTITFFGHSDVCYDEWTKKALYNITEGFIKSGASEFLLGSYGNFDTLAALTVKELKEKYPHIRSILVAPYPSVVCNQNLYDSMIYPNSNDVSTHSAIPKRNKYMVYNSNTIIAFVNKPTGGAAKALQYARKLNKNIINLAEI